MRIDNTITLLVIDVAECEERQKARFTRTRLADDIDVARAVTAQHAKLMFNAAEVGEAKGGDVFVVSWITGEHRKLGRWFGGFAGCPDNVWSFHVGVWEVINRSEFGDIQDKAIVGKLAELVGFESVWIVSATDHLEAVEVGGVVLLESTN